MNASPCTKYPVDSTTCPDCQAIGGHLPTCKVDPEDLADARDAVVRGALGLRPVAYPSDPDKGGHPDQRPCPNWCTVGADRDYEHEVNPGHPMTATHLYEIRLPVAASLYSGRTETGREVHPATIEPHLRQRGQEQPTIEVYLRRYEHEMGKGWHQVFGKVLDLTISDAEELCAVLGHLVKVADA